MKDGRRRGSNAGFFSRYTLARPVHGVKTMRAGGAVFLAFFSTNVFGELSRASVLHLSSRALFCGWLFGRMRTRAKMRKNRERMMREKLFIAVESGEILLLGRWLMQLEYCENSQRGGIWNIFMTLFVG